MLAVPELEAWLIWLSQTLRGLGASSLLGLGAQAVSPMQAPSKPGSAQVLFF